jgi:tricorn protease
LQCSEIRKDPCARSANQRQDDVTRPVRADFAPVFDPDGAFLYFIGAREFNPVYDKIHFNLGFPKGMRPYLVTLRKNVTTPFGRKFEVTEKGSQVGSGSRDLTIDFDGMEDRIEPFPVPEGIYEQIEALRGKVLFTSLPVEGSIDLPILTPREAPDAKAKLEAFDFETRKAETWIDGITDFALSLDRERLIHRAGNRLRVIKTKTSQKPDPQAALDPLDLKSGWIDLKRVRMSIDPPAEWRQMYREA